MPPLPRHSESESKYHWHIWSNKTRTGLLESSRAKHRNIRALAPAGMRQWPRTVRPNRIARPRRNLKPSRPGHETRPAGDRHSDSGTVTRTGRGQGRVRGPRAATEAPTGIVTCTGSGRIMASQLGAGCHCCGTQISYPNRARRPPSRPVSTRIATCAPLVSWQLEARKRAPAQRGHLRV